MHYNASPENDWIKISFIWKMGIIVLSSYLNINIAQKKKFFLFGCALGIWYFPGQGSNLSSDNAESLTPCTARELLIMTLWDCDLPDEKMTQWELINKWWSRNSKKVCLSPKSKILSVLTIASCDSAWFILGPWFQWCFITHLRWKILSHLYL